MGFSVMFTLSTFMALNAGEHAGDILGMFGLVNLYSKSHFCTIRQMTDINKNVTTVNSNNTRNHLVFNMMRPIWSVAF